MLEYLVLLALPIAAYGAWNYLKEMAAGNAKPNKVSWLMWSVAPLIAFFAEISKGVTWAALPILMFGLVPLIILIASFFYKKSYWKIGTVDYLCGLFSFLALILWLATKEANVAIVFAIVSDFSASVPTLRKVLTNPETEPLKPYLAGVASALTSFAAVKYWTFPEYAFPVYSALLCMFFCFLIYRPKNFQK